MSSVIWSRRIAEEFWSEPVTPLTFSLLGDLMAERMVRRPLRAAGLDALSLAPVLHLHASYVYANAALLADVIDLMPAAFRSDGLLSLLPGEARERLRATPMWRAGADAAAIAARLLWREPSWDPWRRAAAFDAECVRIRAALGAAAPPRPDASAAEIYAEIGRLREQLGDYLAIVSWGVVYAYVFYHLAMELASRWAPELVAERAALVVALPGVAPLDAARQLHDLGRRLARDPALWTMLNRHGPASAWHAIATRSGSVAAAFLGFLARHGHRLTGRDLACPTWREAPEVVVGLAARSVDPARPLASSARRERATAAVTAELGRGLAGPARRAAFGPVLAAAQRYCALRENMRYHADFFLARLRALALALGGRLVGAGRLATPSDVCFLVREDLERALVEGTSVTDLAAERRAAYTRDAAAGPPPAVNGEAGTASRATHTASVLQGESGAPGTCRARARLMHGPEEFARVTPGEVVVAAYVDPGWTPVLALAGGLVMEVGGQLSHGAIVARELGIPAVVGVRGATRAISDGDMVEIDAAAATVTVHAHTGGQ